jgi:lipopolysaccharide export system permease protein
MLSKKIFYRELVSNAIKIFIVLVIILPVTELFKLLDQAASGNLPTSTLLTLMIYGTIASFPMVLTIACFLTIVITINRYCKDQEFAIWLSVGVSPFYWLRLTILFAIPMTIICAICTMYITPWATAKSQEYAEYLSKQQANIIISPGIFKESKNNNNEVFYIENYSLTNGYAQKIFAQYVNQGAIYNLSAQSGNVYNNDGIISLVLKNGHRYQLNPANSSQTMTVLGFDTFKASIHQNYTPLDPSRINIPTSTVNQLMKDPTTHAKAELSWRIAVAIMMFGMSIFAVPISIQVGRVQSSLVFLLPPLIYAGYENLILTLNGYINDGRITHIWVVQLTHLVIIGLALALTYLKTLPKGYLWSKNKS